MKKLTSILLALVMALTLCSTAFAEGEATMLPAAVDGVITLTGDVTVSGAAVTESKVGVINITEDNTVLDGAGYKITASDFQSGKETHVINVTAKNVTIKNLTIVGDNNTRHGINIYTNASVTLKDVIIQNCTTAVTVNGGTADITNLTTSGNKWGAINVDNGGKLTLDTTNNLSELGKVWSESDSNSTVDIKDAKYSSVSGDKYCYSSNAADLGVAAIDKTVYATLTAAVAAIEENKVGTITLLKDCEGDGVVVDGGKGITFDLNGYKYTIDKTVGSTGTETNGMQFIKGSTVTIKNGEIVFKNAKMGIKNYCNLTLDNVIMTNTADAEPVVNNCGQLTVYGANTKIISSNYKWAITTGNYGKGDVITTTINAGEISGVAMETPLWETQSATVNESVTTTINGGKISKLGVYDWTKSPNFIDDPTYADAPQLTNWKMDVKDGEFGALDFDGKYTDKVIVTGGTFNTNPAEYVHDNNYVVTKGTDGKYTVAASTGTSSVVLPTGGVGGSMGSLVDTVITANDVDANKELVVTDGNNVSVTLNTTAVGEVAENGKLSLSVTTNTASTSVVEDANKDAYNKVTKGSNAVIVSINLRSNNSNVFTEEKDGAYAIVKVPYKANMKSVTVKHLDANGQVNDLTAANSANLTQNNTFYYDSTTGDITMRLPHFSQYLINGSVSTGYVNRHNSGAVTTDKAESPKTFDAGIAVYGVVTISSVLGMGYVGKKKF